MSFPKKCLICIMQTQFFFQYIFLYFNWWLLNDIFEIHIAHGLIFRRLDFDS